MKKRKPETYDFDDMEEDSPRGQPPPEQPIMTLDELLASGARPLMNVPAYNDQGDREMVDHVDENIATLLGPDELSRNVPAISLPEGATEGSFIDSNALYEGEPNDNPRLRQLIDMLYAVPK